MIATLPKNFALCGDAPLFGTSNPALKLTPVTGGVMLYELKKNALIGQVFFDRKKKTATASIAEGKTFIIRKEGKICAIEPVDGQSSVSDYVVFGKCDKYEYTVYEYVNGTVQPIVALKVTSDPTKGNFYDVYLNEERNLVKGVLIAVAINGLVML